MTSIISIDPGKAFGVAYGYYDDVTPYSLVGAFILPYSEALTWLADLPNEQLFEYIKVVEWYRNRANEFVANLDAVEAIGAIKLKFLNDHQLHWQRPQDKSAVRDSVLHEHGLWQTGKMVGHTDGRDANDAIIHGIAYLKFQKHRPTLEKYFGD